MAVTRIGQSTIKQGLKKNETFTAGIPPILGKFYHMGTVEVGAGGASSIEFTGIPAIYKHLQIRAVLIATAANNPGMRLGNSSLDTAANYAWHHLWGTGSAAFSNGNSNTNFPFVNYNPSTSFASCQVTDILDYANTSKFKTFRTVAGSDTNGGTSEVALWSGLWRSTSAVTNVALIPASGNWAQFSTAALYGVK